MGYAVRCPHCDKGHVEVGKKLWFIHGLVVMARYGTRTLIGCHRCVLRKGALDTLVNLLFGWWCFPWGLATPGVVIQNVIALVRAQDDDATDECLRECGINPAEVKLDASGFTSEQRNMLDAAFAVLSATIRSDGERDPREMDAAVRIVHQLAGGRLSEARIRHEVGRERRKFNVTGLSSEYRVALLQMAVHVVVADHRVSPEEIAYLRMISGRLRIESSVVDRIVAQLMGGPTKPEPSDGKQVAAARAVLGVSYGASLLEIKQAYRSLILKYHPDRVAGDERKKAIHLRRTQEINGAYAVLREEVSRSAAV
jgi:DnaJ like chaperone protein